MADKVSYPQLPSTVWWGVRAVLNRTPSATLDERFLSIQLGVQEAAARQYVAELKRVGILSEDSKATPLANRWRIDETYKEAVSDLLNNSYPASLLQVAPPEDADRGRATAWFVREGLGSGTAGNKAATYLLIGSQAPNESPAKGTTGGKRPARDDGASQPPAKKAAPTNAPTASRGAVAKGSPGIANPARTPEPMPLNINVQIHIGADASTDQIENIFSAMRRYLYNNEAA